MSATSDKTALIPATAHVIWLGSKLPPIPWLAVRSALARGGYTSVVLHGDDASLCDDAPVADLLSRDGFRFSLIDADRLFTGAVKAAIGGPASDNLHRLWPLLKQPAMRADLVRLVVLLREGGVYLDADAITIASVEPLLKCAGFAGLERIALPDKLRLSRNPVRWLQAGSLLAVRDVLSRIAVGPKLFEAIQELFTPAVNNAILGACPNHPTIKAALLDAAKLPVERATNLYELGPRLLQRVTQNQSTDQFQLHDPEVFYPLPPEMSQHYFRPSPESVDAQLVGRETKVVHLYDSVTRRRVGHALDAPWVMGQQNATPFARMVAPFLDELSSVYDVEPP